MADGSVAEPGAESEAAAYETLTLAESLVREAGWAPEQFSDRGPNPPYLRIGGWLRLSLTAYEPCFVSARRDRGPFRSRIGMAAHLARYDALMVDPIAFEECFGPGEGNETVFPFGAWLSVRRVGFGGLELWGRRQGEVTLPLEPLAVASAIWLRRRKPAA
ncbi:hypothetical protein [Methylobacterium sp. Leaf118]|uniref:hypothetical protein n=1 Tax=Methylobacterium sp. Leaf118 TaxID=2876562 RepID=UPI001E411DC9|nr:hypothetical protein [Methylobacterium sp. Leaf118]